MYGVIALRRGSLGLRFLALRANERATSSLGVNVTRTKLIAFAIASALAALFGVMTAYQFEGVEDTRFAALASVSVFALAYLGGITQVWGAVVAGFLVAGGIVSVLLDRLFHIGKYQILLEGVGLVFTAILHPDGIIGALQEGVHKVKARFGRHQAAAPEERAGIAHTTDGLESQTVASTAANS
jgi:ABC-type branched-subunit amino acid transport system permease subunit